MPLCKTFLRDRSRYQIRWIFKKVPNCSWPPRPTPQNDPHLWKSCACISCYLALIPLCIHATISIHPKAIWNFSKKITRLGSPTRPLLPRPPDDHPTQHICILRFIYVKKRHRRSMRSLPSHKCYFLMSWSSAYRASYARIDGECPSIGGDIGIHILGPPLGQFGYLVGRAKKSLDQPLPRKLMMRAVVNLRSKNRWQQRRNSMW